MILGFRKLLVYKGDSGDGCYSSTLVRCIVRGWTPQPVKVTLRENKGFLGY